MHTYRVVERWAERGLCALRCSAGRYHVARALQRMPPLDAALHGDRPHLGFGILVCSASGAIFRVIFESINDLQCLPGPDPNQHEAPSQDLLQACGSSLAFDRNARRSGHR